MNRLLLSCALALAVLAACTPAVKSSQPMIEAPKPVAESTQPALPPLPFEKVPEYWPDPKLPPPRWPQAHPDARPDPGMNRIQYWNKLCKLEAGDFINRTVDDVDSIYLIRPVLVGDTRFGNGIEAELLLNRRYEIEDPFSAWTSLFMHYSKFALFGGGYRYTEIPAIDIEREVPNARLLYSGNKPVHQPFIAQMELTWDPKWRNFRIYTDLMVRKGGLGPYLRYHDDDTERLIDEALKADTGRVEYLPPRRVEERVLALKSRYGIYWRGIRRPQDREMGIAGGEIFVIDLATNEILAYRRGFILAWESPDKQRFTWRSQGTCPEPWPHARSDAFFAKVLKPRPRNELQWEKQ